MKYSKINISVLIFSVFLFPLNLLAQESMERIIYSLNNIIRPIETLKPDSNFEDIDFLTKTIADKEIISLGEVTHGTSEVFDYKDRLLRLLITNLGYKAIGLESDFIAIENIDEYINSRTDSLVFSPGSQIIATNRSMIEWLRKYNKTRINQDKVHIYGLEARGFVNVINKILSVIPAIEEADKKLLEKVKTAEYSKIQKTDISNLNVTISNLQKITTNDLHKHYLVLLSQLVDHYYETKIGSRDEHMAINAIWIKERAKNNKLIIWAHNGHVAKTELYKNPSMGTYLNKQYGSKYFVIATDFNEGSVYVNVFVAKNKPLLGFQPHYYPEVNSNKAYEFYFKQCKFKNFIIEIDPSMKDPVLSRFFNQSLDMRMIGALSIPANKNLSISKNFDLIVFIDKTNSQFN
ncbi:erythromycin esterase-like protein [Chitinophaga niastensis]|uniref:Erythromycin esterase-like protein n=1 Tax=Chitinophaga niastensis TaxID=536980 RepID=A0A2P8HT47_CHINA|nr:erythromycin esterase family protein [Chitinophaga niastensis]PSL49400.1 erythromycin esterase-like protein [Chitinophaga niastensis]